MSVKQIKGLTVEIGGDTTELGKTLNGIDKQSASLSKELGEINKLLKVDPTNTELLAQKQKVLAEAIASTKERLDVLKKAHEDAGEAAKNGNTEAEETMRALEREIIATEQKLSGYEGAARDTEDALNGLSGETKDAADKTGELGGETEKSEKELEKEKGAAEKARKELGDLAEKGADKAAKAMVALAAAVVGAVAAVGKLVLSEAQAADELTTLAATTGLSTETLQKWSYAAAMCGISADTLTGAQTKLIKNMATAQKGTGDAAKAFETLGVRITDANGELRNSEDVFNDALNALGRVGNETERDALAMQIFGKSARELNPVINAGEDALKRFGDEAENVGAVVSDDAVGALNDLNTEVKRTKAQFSALKTETAAEFAPIMVELFKKFQELIKKVKAELKKPEVKEAIKKLGKAIVELVEKGIKVVIKILPTLAKVVTFLVGNLKTLLIVFGSLWAVFKSVKVVTAVIDAFKSMKGIIQTLRGTTVAATTAQEGLNAAQTAGKAAALGLVGAIAGLVIGLGALIVSAVSGSKEVEEAYTEVSDNIKSEAESLRQQVRETQEEFESSISKTDAAATTAKEYIDRLKELEEQESLTGDEQAEYNEILAKLKYLYPDINVEIDEHTGKLRAGADALGDFIDEYTSAAKKQAKADFYKKLLEESEQLNETFRRSKENLKKYSDEELNSARAAMALRDLWKMDEDKWSEYPAIVREAAAALDAYHESENALTEFNGADETFFAENAELLTGVALAADDATESTQALADANANLMDKVRAAGQAADEAADAHFSKLKDAAQNMFVAIDTGNRQSMTELVENLRKNREAVQKWHDNLSKLYERGASQEFVQYLESLGLGYAETVDEIANSTDEELDELLNEWHQSSSDAYAMGQDWGRNVYKGLINGMRLEAHNVLSELSGLAGRMRHTMQNSLGIHSPSTVFEGFGHNTLAGLINGIREDTPDLIRSMRDASDALRSGYDPGPLNAALPDPSVFSRAPAYAASEPYRAAEAAADLGGKLDRILAAIEAGKIIAIDGDKWVGATVDRYDAALGRNAVLAGRGA